MSDSKLVTKFIPAHAGNFTANRAKQGKISEITIHHVAGDMTIEALGKLWQTPGRNGSSHYGVQHEQVGQYVKEADIAWTNGNWDANVRAVTIETSNSGGAPDWPVADDTLDTLIGLVADIAQRNGLAPLELGKTLTWHSMYAATACPGPYLMGKLQYIVDEANKRNAKPPVPDDRPEPDGLYRVQVGAFSNKQNAEGYAKKLNKAGYQAIVKESGAYWKVQMGAFAKKENAEGYAAALRKAGYEAIIKEG